MDNAQYRANIYKTLSQKPARLGLKYLAGKQVRTNIAHLITGVATEAFELLEGLQPYVLGEQYTDALKENAAEELGDFGFYLVGLAKEVKAKLPGSGKKVKLDKGTRLLAILTLMKHSGDLLDLQKKYFYGVKMSEVSYPAGVRKVLGKEVAYEAGVKDAFDAVKQTEYDTEFVAKVKTITEALADVYWRLCYDMTGQPPAPIFAGNIAKLAVRYPEGTFDQRTQEERKKDKELAAMNAANAATVGATPAQTNPGTAPVAVAA